MVVPSLAIDVWVEADGSLWAVAPWLDEPMTAPDWFTLFENVKRAKLGLGGIGPEHGTQDQDAGNSARAA